MSDSGWIMTHSGIPFWPLDPGRGEIRIADIAWHLSREPRFQGATDGQWGYSVAQHSVSVSEQVPQEDALWGLLHDASEAYIRDLPRPVKHRPEMEFYRRAETDLATRIAKHFGLSDNEPKSVKIADRRMLRTEQRDLMPPQWPGEIRDDAEPYAQRVRVVSPIQAFQMFANRWNQLTGDKSLIQ